MTPKKKTAPDWRPPFLASLSTNCNVSRACRAAGISRQTAYEYRKTDDAFSAAWEDAIEEAVEDLETEARRRALEGCEVPIIHEGRVVATIHKYSDTLTIFLLKAHRPKVYRENQAGASEDDPVHHRHTIEYVNDWRNSPRPDGAN